MPLNRFSALAYCRRVLYLAALAVSTASAQAEFNPAPDAPSPQPAAARVIVKFAADAAVLRKHVLSVNANATATEARAIAALRAQSLGTRIGLPLAGGRAIDAHTQVVRGTGASSADLAARLALEPDVEYAVVDERRRHHSVPNDPYYAEGPPVSGLTGGPVVGQWYLRAPAGEVLSSINAARAWDTTVGSANIVVAILDTGVRPEHPDFANRLLPGYDMIDDTAAANDGSARDADATDPGDWITPAETNDQGGAFYQCGTQNSTWHGTQTASLIGAASNNAIGMAGVAWGVRLLPVRVLGKCGGYDSDIIAAMRWAAGLSVPGVPLNATPARVINMSLGSTGACQPGYVDAIIAIGTKSDPAIVVASAGNSTGHNVGTPANCPGVLAVAALRHSGTKVGFSDIGPEIALSAPGGNCVNSGSALPCLYPILTATNTGTNGPVAASYSGSFHPSVGTSFSAPLVAGTVALMLSVNPSLSPAQIRSALRTSARAFPVRDPASTTAPPACRLPDNTEQLECYCTTSTCGAGMLDAAAAVASVMPAAPVVEFHHAILDTYFITANATEAAAIDAGSAGPGWSRTGLTFKSGGSAQVCRFYGSLAPGPNSHFYTLDPAECASLKQVQATTALTLRRWNFESLDFNASPLIGGTCVAGMVPVFRAYNNGFARGVDSNHRITTSPSAIQEVAARGWISEGPVMCVPG